MKGSYCVHFDENNITPGQFDTCYNAYIEQNLSHGPFAGKFAYVFSLTDKDFGAGYAKAGAICG
ncbi:hypothetical protein EGT74_20880 [Chitinophaga lutea]|uniref:Uncharacterized protein n=1 Tax=Chitinophaga lutea TaxID=2488634 RepID=A0A3N4PL93_9BACT|nr:hypothetical protein EGT74_20880 [Chitinophaga lutea]